MGGEILTGKLSAQIRKARRNSGAPQFVLDVAIEVTPGITILFGPSGAGKSTLLDCLAGLARPDAGKIAAEGELLFDSEGGIDLPAQKRRIAYVFQTLALFPHLSTEENIAFGLRDVFEAERRARVEGILEAFHVEKLRKQKPGEISGGEKQRIALARSLVTKPRVLLLDEPLTGLDAALKAGIVDDLRAWNRANGIPILYVTHNREEVDALGERVIAMESGRIVDAGTPMEVLDAPRRKKLAQAAGFENLLNGSVLAVRETDGVMRVQLGEGDCEIEVPLAFALAGDRVQVAIRAGDILLAAEKPHGLSARNLLEGQIVSVQNRGNIGIVQVNCGVMLVAHVTPGAVRALNLAPGQSVWLVVKTHSCHLVE